MVRINKSICRIPKKERDIVRLFVKKNFDYEVVYSEYGRMKFTWVERKEKHSLSYLTTFLSQFSFIDHFNYYPSKGPYNQFSLMIKFKY